MGVFTKKSLERFRRVVSEPERNVPPSQTPLRGGKKPYRKASPSIVGPGRIVNRTSGRAGVGRERVRVPAWGSVPQRS